MKIFCFKIVSGLLITLLLNLSVRAQEEQTDTIQSGVLKILQNLPSHKYPYGSALLMKNFPREWTNMVNSANSISTVSTGSAYIDTLSIFTYKDYAAVDRYPLPVQDVSIRKIFPTKYLKKLGLRPVTDTIPPRVLKIWQEGGIGVYSAMVRQELSCKGCEYQPTQLVNVLFTVSGNMIRSRLAISYIKGDDLEQRARYFRITEDGSIFIKDFSVDELKSSFLKEQKWCVGPGAVLRRDK